MSLLRGSRETPVSRPIPVPRSEPHHSGGAGKRSLDLILAATGVVVAAPVLLLLYVWIRLHQPGSGVCSARSGSGPGSRSS